MNWFNAVIAGGNGQGYSPMGAGGGSLDWVRELGVGGGAVNTSPFSADGFNNLQNDTFGFVNAMIQGSGIPIDVGGGMASAQQLLGPELFNEAVNVNDMPGTAGYRSTSEIMMPDWVKNGGVDKILAEAEAEAAKGGSKKSGGGGGGGFFKTIGSAIGSFFGF